MSTDNADTGLSGPLSAAADPAAEPDCAAKPDCAAIVLAGGSARRFGSDKLSAVVDGVSVLDRAIRSASSVADDILVVGRRHRSVRWVDEPRPRVGPLGAISHALTAVDAEIVVVLAGDHPFLEPRLLRLLVESLMGEPDTRDGSPDVDAAVPVDHRGRPQPLVAAVRRRISPSMASAVLGGERSIVDFLRTIHVHWLHPGDWVVADPDGRSFIDIDTVEDLEHAASLPARGARPPGNP